MEAGSDKVAPLPAVPASIDVSRAVVAELSSYWTIPILAAASNEWTEGRKDVSRKQAPISSTGGRRRARRGLSGPDRAGVSDCARPTHGHAGRRRPYRDPY